MKEKLHCAIDNKDGWWYGTVYTANADGTPKKVYWRSSAWQDRKSAQLDALSMYRTILARQEK